MRITFKTLIAVGCAVMMFCAGVEAKEFQVGVHLPLTGALARPGRSNYEGMAVAVEVFNRKNPNCTVKLVTIDDESAPAKGVAAVEKLDAQGVVGIIGGYGSVIAGPAANTANKLGMTYFTVGTTSTMLTEKGFKTFFRPNHSPGYANGMIGIISDLGMKSVSLAYSTREGTAEIAQLVQKGLAAKNVKVILHPYEPNVTDFKPIVNKIKLQDRPEVLAMVGYENDHLGILRAAKVLRPNVKAIVGPYSTTTSKIVTEFPDLVNNVLGFVMLPHPVDLRNQEVKDYHETFRRIYKRDGDDSAAQWGYIQTLIICEAVKRAAEKGTPTKASVLAEMRKTNRDSMLGKVRFDAVGDNPSFLTRVGQAQGGKIPVVWPKEEATGKVRLPAVPW